MNLAAHTWLANAAGFNAAPTGENFPLAARAGQAAYGWMHYAWRTIWPVGLTPIDGVLVDHAPGAALFGWSVAALVGAGALCGGWEKGRAQARFFFAAYLCVLVPMLGLTERPHFPSDRYAALPQAVLAAALALGLARLNAELARRNALAGEFAAAAAHLAEVQRLAPEYYAKLRANPPSAR